MHDRVGGGMKYLKACLEGVSLTHFQCMSRKGRVCIDLVNQAKISRSHKNREKRRLGDEDRWNSCKHNKQDSSNRSGTANPSQTPSPEGEKLHSDSGISVDSQSLQEGQGLPHTVVKIDGGLPLTLSLHTREEVEKLLSHSCDSDGPGAMQETDWCSLAGLLGYEEERIASFRQEERPIQALLSDWASQDTASVDTLCTALRKINREDIAQSIMLKPTATSTV
ncbi:hypothetical protein AOLI_G00139750 [Acnodon oligacanthus]